MKQLKLKCPFAGYGSTVAYITLFLSSIISAFIALYTEDKTNSVDDAFSALAITAVLSSVIILIISHLRLTRLTEDDKFRISKADEPAWRKPTWEEKRRAAATMTVLHFEFILTYIFAGIMPIILICDSDFEITPLFIGTVITIFLLITAVYIWHIIRSRVWWKIDDTAACAILPVSSVYVVKSSAKTTWTVTNYAVIHTNEDKLILSAKTERMSRSEAKKYRLAKIEKICIIKYKGMITYFRCT